MRKLLWPEAISDGLSTPCSCCDVFPAFDYHVDDELWMRVVPQHLRTKVICLPCLDKLATDAGYRIGPYLHEVQYTGNGCTVVLRPYLVHTYGVDEENDHE